jgi:hypothetical protein
MVWNILVYYDVFPIIRTDNLNRLLDVGKIY